MKNIENKINEIVDRVLQESLQEKEDKWIQDVDMKEGAFTDYCKGKGMLDGEGDVTCECAEAAKKEGGKPAKMAQLYLNMNKDKCKSLQEDMGKMPEDRDDFDGRDSEVVGVYSNIKKQRMEEDELEEGNAFSEARCKAICAGDDSFEVDGKEYEVKDADEKDKESCGCKKMNESNKKVVTLSEEEMIELIQRLVIEEKAAKGLKDTEKTLKASAKVNDEAMKEVNKKMKDYVKAGSNDGYEENPKGFPKGNGEMGDDDKMMYHASDAVEEYIDQIARSGGMENLEYDAIKPNEDWIEMNIMGDSKTGNSQEYANAVATDANEKVNDRRKKNWLAKLKKQSYQKAVQPVEDFAGSKKSDKAAMSPDEVMAAISENIDDKKKVKINEEINKMKSIFTYNNKTQ